MSPPRPLTIVKLRGDGSEAARYPGTLLSDADGWWLARAPWEMRRVDLGYLVFEPGDTLLEYFAREELVNAFAIFAASGRFKGWYCNIAHNWLDGDTLYWRDLYLDLIVYPDGRQLVLDEDELAASGLVERDPALYQRVVSALGWLQRTVEARAYPFSDLDAAAKGDV